MASGDEEQEERGFTIVDRRGEGREPGSGAESGERSGGEVPGIDFSTFVLSLGTSALYHLGAVTPEGEERSAELNLPLARQTIDTLSMLEEKTRGNLDAEEAKLLESLLYELRMRFVEAGR